MECRTRLVVSGAFLSLVGNVVADEPPPLAPPAELPAITAPSLPAEPPAATGPQPILVVPGLPTRRPSDLPHFEPAGPQTRIDDRQNDAGPPPLTGPGGVPARRHSTEPQPRYSAQPAFGAIPGRDALTLEPAPVDGPTTVAPIRSVPAGTDRAEPARRAGSSQDRPTVRRGLFNLFGLLGPPAPPREVEAPVPVEPHETDPAADEAFKRRLERQVRLTLGGQLRALDVRVVGRNVHVRARVVRFWQKRTARHTIESLPMLRGYRARIEVTD